MSIAAAHLLTLPVRYAIGRWYNIPTNTFRAFNGVDVGLHILVASIGARYKVNKWKIPFYQKVTLGIAYHTCVTLSALYITSKLTDSMPLECALMTTLASVTNLCVLKVIMKWLED